MQNNLDLINLINELTTAKSHILSAQTMTCNLELNGGISSKDGDYLYKKLDKLANKLDGIRDEAFRLKNESVKKTKNEVKAPVVEKEAELKEQKAPVKKVETKKVVKKTTDTKKKQLNKQVKPKTIKNATYVESVEFSDIEKINIGKVIGDLPVLAVYSGKHKFNATFKVMENKSVVIKAGSIICKGLRPSANNLSKEDSARRAEMMKDGRLAAEQIDGYTGVKYVLKEDVRVDSIRNAKKFVLGRELIESDSRYEVMVDTVPIDKYMYLGIKG